LASSLLFHIRDIVVIVDIIDVDMVVGEFVVAS